MGGVLVHCASGRDRTGLLSLLLLALAGVVPDAIAEDYEVSTERLRPLYERMGFGDVAGRVAARMALHHTTVRRAVLDTLASLDVEATLHAGGLADRELTALRARLLAPGEPGAVPTAQADAPE